MGVTVKKAIITAALTGNMTVPSQTPHLPFGVKDIVGEAMACYQAGCAVVHLHTRDSLTGRPVLDLDLFGEYLRGIKNSCDVVLCTSTGGGPGMKVQDRVAVVPKFKPEMASFNMGSMNFGLFPVVKHIKQFKHDWEKEYLEATKDFVFKNTFSDLEYICGMMKASNTKPELECYDVGHIYNAEFLVSEALLDLPVHIQFVMGVLGGIGSHIEDLIIMKRTADRLFREQYTWSVIGVGYPAEFYLGAQALMMGGHVRVGLEDNVRLDKHTLATNPGLVEKMCGLARELGRDLASPTEARQVLGLKGLDKVGF
jgi:uncharacterized protein (DUF849 family)